MATRKKTTYPCPACGTELYRPDPGEKAPENKRPEELGTEVIHEMCQCPRCGWQGSLDEIKDRKINRELG